MGFNRSAASVLAVVLGVMTGTAPALAQPSDRAAQGSLMFVLDASGSMAAPADSGGTRMDAAKGAMTALIDQLPINLDVGLQVYGTGTGTTPQEKEAGCADVRTLHEVGRPDRAAMNAAVAGIQPRGYTPIGAALERAADALPEEGPRAIVLISDGIDTCAPPAPCEVAEDLDGAGVELAVQTVGFQVDDAAREELGCIAKKTGGDYHDVPEAGSLDDLLPEIADQALRFYKVAGESASGADEPAEAPYLPPGQYKDRVPRNTPQYYRVHVPDGATGRFTAVHLVNQRSERVESGVDLRLVDGKRRVCAGERGYREYVYEGPETAGVTWSPSVPDPRCDPRGPHYLEVTWDSADRGKYDRVELTVALEPGVTGGQGPGPATEPVAFTEPGGDPSIVWGGGSFNSAATLPGPGRYADRLAYDDYCLYRVWLDWGQGLAYRLRVRGGDPLNTTVATEIRGPGRRGPAGQWSRSSDYTGQPVALGPVATPRVRYANRGGPEWTRPAARAGWYYIVVRLSPPWDDSADEPESPTIELDVQVTGERVAGPQYAELDVPTEEPPMPEGPSTWEPQAVRGRSATEGSISAWWLGGGLGAVGLGVALAVVLVRRRQS